MRGDWMMMMDVRLTACEEEDATMISRQGIMASGIGREYVDDDDDLQRKICDV